MPFSRLPDLREEERRVARHMKPPHCGEAYRKPCALSQVRTQAIGALSQGFTDWATQAPKRSVCLDKDFCQNFDMWYESGINGCGTILPDSSICDRVACVSLLRSCELNFKFHLSGIRVWVAYSRTVWFAFSPPDFWVEENEVVMLMKPPPFLDYLGDHFQVLQGFLFILWCESRLIFLVYLRILMK